MQERGCGCIIIYTHAQNYFRAAGVIMLALFHNFELIICDLFVEKLLAIPKVHKREESSWLSRHDGIIIIKIV
jgi:hypothetical protein